MNVLPPGSALSIAATPSQALNTALGAAAARPDTYANGSVAPRPITELLRRRADPVTQLLAVRALENQGRAPKGIMRLGLTPAQLPAAYALQDELAARIESPTNPRVGWKIGFSTVVGRKPLGISEPAYGPLFAAGNVGGTIKTSSFANLLVEQEIALVLDQNIYHALTPAELLTAIGSVRLGFELPSKRFTGAIGAPDGPTAADMVVDCLASHSFSLGLELPITAATSRHLDLEMTRNSEPFAAGSTTLLDNGAGGLGPLNALAWLVDKLVERRARRGEPESAPVLRAGDIVYTGAIPKPIEFESQGQHLVRFTTKAGDAPPVALDVQA